MIGDVVGRPRGWKSFNSLVLRGLGVLRTGLLGIGMLGMGLLGMGLLLAPGSLSAAEVRRAIEPSATTGSSTVVVVDDVPLAHTAQFLPVDAAGEIVGKGRIQVQTAKVLEQLEVALKTVGSQLNQAVKLNIYLAKPEHRESVEQALAKLFTGSVKPAVCFVCGELPLRDALVAMDAVAVVPEGKSAADKVTFAKAPALDGAEHQHVAVLPAGGKVYISGQAEKGTLAEATQKTLESLRATLQFLELSDANIVQVKAFLQPMSDVVTVRQEYAKFCGNRPLPPLVLVEWKYPLIEIELIAWAGPAKKGGEVVEYLTPPFMKPSPVFSRVTRVNRGGLVYTAGLYGADTTNGETETLTLLKHLESVLKQSGSDLKHMVKATYYVASDESSKKLNELRPKFYDPQRPPAASKAPVSNPGRVGHTTTLDMIAVPVSRASTK